MLIYVVTKLTCTYLHVILGVPFMVSCTTWGLEDGVQRTPGGFVCYSVVLRLKKN